MPRKLVHLYPVEGVHLYPYPAVECDVTPEDAEFLLSASPPPFTTSPPGDAPAEPPREPSDQGGSSDATEV